MSGDVATERLFFDLERTKLVVEGDPAARFLAVTPGNEIPEGFKAPSGAKAAAKPVDKQAAAPANKGLTITKEAAAPKKSAARPKK